jgi:alpha-tubulin suppressor-like RCC1 family protein
LSNGTVMTWGTSNYGELGNGLTGKGSEALAYSSTVPILVPGLSGVTAIAAGGADDVALLNNGTLMAWGENKNGQLGDGTTVEKPTPTPVKGLAGVKAVAIGGVANQGGHMLALLNSGTVMAIGDGRHGQLGDGVAADSPVPVQVKGLGNVTSVAASPSHSLAVLADGTVRAWGANADGELGVASGPQTCPTAEPCSTLPIPVPGLANVTGVAASFRTSFAISAGHVFSWGFNEQGQLGIGSTTGTSRPTQVPGLSGVVRLATAQWHSLATYMPSALSSPLPAPDIELLAGPASLTARWTSSETTERWLVSWRPVVKPRPPWGKFIPLPPLTRSYTISGLGPTSYEVMVKNQIFGVKVVTGTPLG